jgi:hypothetical protein
MSSFSTGMSSTNCLSCTILENKVDRQLISVVVKGYYPSQKEAEIHIY